MDDSKKAGKLLLIAILSELVTLTDALAAPISGLFSQNTAIKGALTFIFVYIFWWTGIVLIRNFHKKQSDIQFQYNEKPSRVQLLIGFLLLAVTVIISFNNWGGFKVEKELMYGIHNGGIGLGIAYFLAQYFYYYIETVLMVMILSFAQEAGTIIWGKKNIPYGGIVLAIVWGLIHIAFHGVADGLTSTLYAILYGCAFVVMNKNNKYALPLIFFMFIL